MGKRDYDNQQRLRGDLIVPPPDFIVGAQNMGGVNNPHPRLGRVSVIAPVKDEEASIGPLIDALLKQTYQPAEIILTDGGSSDRTREIIREFQKVSQIPIVLIETAHAYPGRGRNLAIARAGNDWVASIDAGIVPEADWLRELVRAAEREPGARIIYGRFKPVTDTFFTECAAVTYVPPSELMRRFVASSLFHRSAWEAAGRFREDVRTGEDLLFFRGLERAGVPEGYSKNALVNWWLRPSVGSTFQGFATSSRHSMKGGLGFNWQLKVSLYYLLMLATCLAGFFWPPLLLSVPVVLFLRAERRIHRWYRAESPRRVGIEMLNPARVLMVIWLNTVIDAAMFWGVFQWAVRDYVWASFEGISKRGKEGASINFEQ